MNDQINQNKTDAGQLFQSPEKSPNQNKMNAMLVPFLVAVILVLLGVIVLFALGVFNSEEDNDEVSTDVILEEEEMDEENPTNTDFEDEVNTIDEESSEVEIEQDTTTNNIIESEDEEIPSYRDELVSDIQSELIIGGNWNVQEPRSTSRLSCNVDDLVAGVERNYSLTTVSLTNATAEQVQTAESNIEEYLSANGWVECYSESPAAGELKTFEKDGLLLEYISFASVQNASFSVNFEH